MRFGSYYRSFFDFVEHTDLTNWHHGSEHCLVSPKVRVHACFPGQGHPGPLLVLHRGTVRLPGSVGTGAGLDALAILIVPLALQPAE